MHQLIASPFLDQHLIVHPGHTRGVRIGPARYEELRRHQADEPLPDWLLAAALEAWGVDLAQQPSAGTLMVRERSAMGYARASWEINKGCDYACDHCYLGLKKFEGLSWENKMRLLRTMRDAGVLWLQITGGEPLIDRDFPGAYRYATELGMMVSISSNGSQLSKPRILDLFREAPPYRITISVYGASTETYDTFTHSRGAFDRFIRGLDAAQAAGLNVRLNVIVHADNEHEVGAMEEIASSSGFGHVVYSTMSPTIQGNASPLPTQSTGVRAKRSVFKGCNAGRTFFHSDPFGKASICKVGRDPQFDLIGEGLDALRGLESVADSLQLRTGGCSGCQLSGACWICRPLAKLYQEAKAPLGMYCQHGQERS